MRTPSRRGVILALTAALLAGTATACTGTPPKPTSAANATFVYANNLTVMVGWDPATDYSNESIAMANMYEGLTRYDSSSGKVQPLLATSWKSSGDGLTWTFTLRPGVTFSTGKPMDAAAAKAALDRTIKLAGGASYEWDPVKSIEATDPTTLVFHLKYAAPLDLIASSGYGAYIYDTTATTGDLATWFEAGHAAGTGPYVVQSFNKGQEKELTLSANPGYWGGWTGTHYTTVEFRVVPQETTATQLLQAGQVTYVPRVSPALFASLKGAKDITTEQASSFQNILALFNTASGPMRDQRVRSAIAAAIDYQGIATALKGAVVPATGVIPKGLLGYTSDVSQQTNLAAAQSSLASAGYGPGGKKLALTLTYASGTPELDTIVSLVKSDLAKIGVTLHAKALAWETQWALGKSSNLTKRQDIFLFYWYPDYADPYSWFVNIYRSAKPVSFNLSYWDDASVNTAIDGLQALTATDRGKAETAYVDLQRTIAQQAISPILGVDNFQRAYSSGMQGYVDNPSYSNVVFAHELTPAG